MSNESTRKRRLAEFHEADAAYRETGSAEHAEWRHRAMRSKDTTPEDRQKAQEMLIGRVVDLRNRARDVIRKGCVDWREGDN